MRSKVRFHFLIGEIVDRKRIFIGSFFPASEPGHLRESFQGPATILLGPELFLQSRMSWVGLGKGEGRKCGMKGMGGCKEGDPGCHRVEPARRIEGGED